MATAERNISNFGDCGNEDRYTFFKQPGRNVVRSCCPLEQLFRTSEISHSDADLKAINVEGEFGRCNKITDKGHTKTRDTQSLATT